jgi:hypothetical protein
MSETRSIGRPDRLDGLARADGLPRLDGPPRADAGAAVRSLIRRRPRTTLALAVLLAAAASGMTGSRTLISTEPAAGAWAPVAGVTVEHLNGSLEAAH